MRLFGCAEDHGRFAQTVSKIHGLFHPIDGTKDDYVEVALADQVFCTSGMHLRGEADVSDDFTEKGGLLVLRLGECNLEIRTEKVKRNAGKAST